MVLVAAAACGADDVELYPINPGGGGGGGNLPRPDAAPDGPDMGGMVSGKVCAIEDARNPQDCTSGAGGVTVTIGTAMATTAADGTFMINRPAGATLWMVSGTGFTPSAMSLSSGTDIPLLETTAYDAIVNENSMATGNNTGALIVKVRKNGNPVVGAEGSSTPSRVTAYYDTPDPVTWETDTTDAAGAIWLAGVPAGMATVEIMTSSKKTLPPVLVIADTITWIFASL